MTSLKDMVNEKRLNRSNWRDWQDNQRKGTERCRDLLSVRIQAVEGWGNAVWPSADVRPLQALRKLGIYVKDADELQEMVETLVNWDTVGTMGLPQGGANGDGTAGASRICRAPGEGSGCNFWMAKSRNVGRLQQQLSSSDRHLISPSAVIRTAS